MAKHKGKNGVSSSKRKRKYERTTPVGRIVRHLERAVHTARFAATRLQAWAHGADPRLLEALARVRSSEADLSQALSKTKELFETRWVPPGKAPIVLCVGDDVMVAKRYRSKYLQVYPAHVIENLVITKILDSGEIAVRGGQETQFIVAKSHLRRKSRRRKAKEATASSSPG